MRIVSSRLREKCFSKRAPQGWARVVVSFSYSFRCRFQCRGYSACLAICTRSSRGWWSCTTGLTRLVSASVQLHAPTHQGVRKRTRPFSFLKSSRGPVDRPMIALGRQRSTGTIDGLRIVWAAFYIVKKRRAPGLRPSSGSTIGEVAGKSAVHDIRTEGRVKSGGPYEHSPKFVYLLFRTCDFSPTE